MPTRWCCCGTEYSISPSPYLWGLSSNTLSALQISIVNASHFDTVNPLQKQQVQLYIDALLDWNHKMNLTAVKEASDVMDRHIENSLSIIPPIQSSYILHCESSFENLNHVDVGSDVGLPGLILAIACPGTAGRIR
ncbi:unnamed protein product [Lactuca virosa]|uniref:Uncharacterized protein n=1 Tax=Lactuca virosa TaxID=75947 RepID=A0AAU9NHU3_9ASTR|nr:unnamed protein product [Lactuca virosa]